MKPVILSADNPCKIYMVPDAAAENLDEYCLKFCMDWLKHAPEAVKYRVIHSGYVAYCYNETAFIEYLNLIFPKEPSFLVMELGFEYDKEKLPEKYKSCPEFNF